MYRLKSANPAKQEQARLEVENAEDDLIQKTEVAITLMKTVLENVRNLLCRATLILTSSFSRSLSRISTSSQRRSSSISPLPLRHYPPSRAKLKNLVLPLRASTGKHSDVRYPRVIWFDYFFA